MGDSKSVTGQAWVESLIAGLNSDGAASDNVFIEDTPRNWAVGGYKLSTLKSSFDTFMLEHTASVLADKNVFFINVGANDVYGAIVEATWKANYAYIIDAILVKHPLASIFITKPWRRDYGTECDTVAGYIDDLVAAYAISNPNHVYVGDDERTWLEGGDNGVTMTSDGIHYSTAGHAAKVVALRARILAELGY